MSVPDIVSAVGERSLWRSLLERRYSEPIAFVSLFGGLFSLLIALCGIVMVSLQLLGLQDSMDAQSYTAINNSLDMLDDAFLSNPDLRPYFFKNASLPKKIEDQQRITSLAELHLDSFDFWFVEARHVELTKYGDGQAWRQYFIDSFRNSQVLCKVLHDEQQEYSDNLRAIAFKSGCAGVSPRRRSARRKVEWFFPN